MITTNIVSSSQVVLQLKNEEIEEIYNLVANQADQSTLSKVAAEACKKYQVTSNSNILFTNANDQGTQDVNLWSMQA